MTARNGRSRPHPARAAALALGALVLVTAFLAAAFPRGVEAYETRGVRHALGSVPAGQRTVEITVSRTDMTGGDPAAACAAGELTRQDRAIRGQFHAPLRIAGGETQHGVRTTKPLSAQDAWLPRPDGVAPGLSLYAAAGLGAHATLAEGRLPHGAASGKHTLEAAVTVATARALALHVGSELHLEGLTIRISGLLTPRAPDSAYWSVDPLMAAARQDTTPGLPPHQFWRAGLLLSPQDGPALLSTGGEPEKFWRYPLDTRALTARDAPLLRDRLVSLEHGAALARLRAVAGGGALADSAVDGLLDAFVRTRTAVAPVIAVAAYGIGTVAGVVLLMTAGLTAARRHAELALLRARGASLAGLAGRMAAETGAVALPAAAAGAGLALLLVPGEGVLPSLLTAAGAGLLGTLALPLRAVVAHRRPRPVERADAAGARPSRRRMVAELTVLILAVGAVLALRGRSTATGGVDALVSAAPVLIGVIAALVLMRLYPLPLRLAARPAARTAGLTGFLSLARAGRAPGTAGLPLLALVVALTTASFGGSVLAGVAAARDRAALTAVGAEARISAGKPLPEELRRAVGRCRASWTRYRCASTSRPPTTTGRPSTWSSPTPRRTPGSRGPPAWGPSPRGTWPTPAATGRCPRWCPPVSSPASGTRRWPCSRSSASSSSARRPYAPTPPRSPAATSSSSTPGASPAATRTPTATPPPGPPPSCCPAAPWTPGRCAPPCAPTPRRRCPSGWRCAPPYAPSSPTRPSSRARYASTPPRSRPAPASPCSPCSCPSSSPPRSAPNSWPGCARWGCPGPRGGGCWSWRHCRRQSSRRSAAPWPAPPRSGCWAPVRTSPRSPSPAPRAAAHRAASYDCTPIPRPCCCRRRAWSPWP
ncbi:hypothetical protein STRLI_005086 [Streptomyces libani subsp. libani]|uniref:Uncharacterized protein n=1 Tax=Streptomyces nigrescens TaxID=1920 RepID=A0ABY7ILT2_STRNI|nr:hypothetical protein [Streptomyces libani]WAT98968.1 hypothetical protein STRLI_005086 [Streptomyces libani subsp. libani]